LATFYRLSASRSFIWLFRFDWCTPFLLFYVCFCPLRPLPSHRIPPLPSPMHVPFTGVSWIVSSLFLAPFLFWIPDLTLLPGPAMDPEGLLGVAPCRKLSGKRHVSTSNVKLAPCNTAFAALLVPATTCPAKLVPSWHIVFQTPEYCFTPLLMKAIGLMGSSSSTDGPQKSPPPEPPS